VIERLATQARTAGDVPVQILDYEPAWRDSYAAQQDQLSTILPQWLARTVEYIYEDQKRDAGCRCGVGNQLRRCFRKAASAGNVPSLV